MMKFIKETIDEFGYIGSLIWITIIVVMGIAFVFLFILGPFMIFDLYVALTMYLFAGVVAYKAHRRGKDPLVSGWLAYFTIYLVFYTAFFASLSGS